MTIPEEVRDRFLSASSRMASECERTKQKKDTDTGNAHTPLTPSTIETGQRRSAITFAPFDGTSTIARRLVRSGRRSTGRKRSAPISSSSTIFASN
jgi:hypothetical protein